MITIWRITIGNNYHSWLQSAQTFASAVAKANERLEKNYSACERRNRPELVITGVVRECEVEP